MKKIMKNTSLYIQLIAMMLITGISTCIAQSEMYIPKDGKIFFSGNAAIFSNVLNQGKLGVGKNAAVNFSGKKWENDIQSLITDESNDGEGVYPVGTNENPRGPSHRSTSQPV